MTRLCFWHGTPIAERSSLSQASSGSRDVSRYSPQAIWGKETSLTKGATADAEPDLHLTIDWRGQQVATRLQVSAVELGGQLIPANGYMEIWSIELANERDRDQSDVERRRKATMGRSVERDM